jgi:hypothetical protein
MENQQRKRKIGTGRRVKCNYSKTTESLENIGGMMLIIEEERFSLIVIK